MIGIININQYIINHIYIYIYILYNDTFKDMRSILHSFTLRIKSSFIGQLFNRSISLKKNT
jgi:hypothetical protein